MKEEMKAKEDIQKEPEEKAEEVASTPVCVETETPAEAEETVKAAAETVPKTKKPASEKPVVEKLSLKFKPEEFALIQNAADAANLSVSEYAMNILMEAVQATSTETVSEKETA